MGFCPLKPPSEIKINSSALWDAARIHRLFYTWEKLESYRQTWQTKLWWTRCPCLIQCLYYTNDDMMHLINVSQGRVSCPFNIADESVCVSTNLIRHFDILLLSFCIKYLSTCRILLKTFRLKKNGDNFFKSAFTVCREKRKIFLEFV